MIEHIDGTNLMNYLHDLKNNNPAAWDIVKDFSLEDADFIPIWVGLPYVTQTH